MKKFPKVIYVTQVEDEVEETLLAWRSRGGLTGCHGQKAAVYELREVKTVREIDPELV